MYRTDRHVRTVGPFGGRLVVSMRPFARDEVDPVSEITRPLWHAHGGPVHVGDVGAIGISDLARPDWGDAVPVAWGERPVFWACGVTSQEALRGALEAGVIDEAWTHAPGHMFIADATPATLGAQSG